MFLVVGLNRCIHLMTFSSIFKAFYVYIPIYIILQNSILTLINVNQTALIQRRIHF